MNNIRCTIAENNGVIACQINREKGEISIVYDKFILALPKLIESLEDKGYTVI